MPSKQMLHLNEAAMAHSCNTKKEGMRQIEKRSASPTMGEILNGEEHLTGCCKSFLRKQLIQILTMSLEKEALFGGKFLACRLVKHQRSKLGELQNIHPQVGARATVLEILVNSRFCGMSRAKDQVHDLTVVGPPERSLFFLPTSKSHPNHPKPDFSKPPGCSDQQIPEGGQNLMPAKAHDVLRLVVQRKSVRQQDLPNCQQRASSSNVEPQEHLP